jgi:hypothetical protein
MFRYFSIRIELILRLVSPQWRTVHCLLTQVGLSTVLILESSADFGLKFYPRTHRICFHFVPIHSATVCLDHYCDIRTKHKTMLPANKLNTPLISGFRRDYVDVICALLGYYEASWGNCLPTFRDNLSVPTSWGKSPNRKERKPATYNVDFGKYGWVAIRRRDDIH